MSTKFFTNHSADTLLQKFEGIFKHTNVYYFDALVGFFRASGYFRLRKHLDKVAKIRILVGINVDHLISEAARKGLEFNFNTEVTRDEFLIKLRSDIQQAEYQKEVEDGVIQFIDDIISRKIEIKAHPNRNIHAKIYIFRQEVEHTHAGYGAVITGSSNLTEAGIETNFEFNVELRDYDDIKFATETFNKLWEESVDILPIEVETLKKSTYLNSDFTPFEIYIKFLIEYFGKSIEYDPDSVADLPKGYKKLEYQIDAVNDGYQKLLKHNGFILADVVGLGKTIIATIIAKKFYFSNGIRTRILIIHPPALKRNWEKTIYDFQIHNFVKFITNGSLHHIEHPEDYDLIIVDEAHKFRSDESLMFDQLQRLCKTPRRRPAPDGSKEKKVILITATPLNNKPEDIRNQLYLFQDSKRSTLEIGNLQNFFRPLIDRYEKLKKEKDKGYIAREVKNLYEDIRVKVLQPLLVRRTRTDIRATDAYRKDIEEQGLSFPGIVPPKQILYQLDDKLNQLYDQTLETIKDVNKGLRYYRYQAIRFLKPDLREHYKRADTISMQLATIMRVLLVKRIDSSFHAFKMSLNRYCNANLAMLKMIENNRIYIAPDLKVSDFILNENEQELTRLLEELDNPHKIQKFEVSDFDEEFIEGIKRDQQILQSLVNAWQEIDYDPKLIEFEQRLENELLSKTINDNSKLVVFSESKETTQYLKERLCQKGFTRILSVDSSNQSDLVDAVADNFDANLSRLKQRNDYDILITTEVLAEGVNLHRSNVIVNYDIPWNATRLMQRIGRVNRIGTESSSIHIYNFFPTARTDNEIELNKKAFIKLQAFHSALGEDSQIYSQEEEYGTFGLFEKLPEEDRDERTIFLNELRKYRDEDPEGFKKIKNMPKRARTGRKDKSRKDSTITYLKNERRDSFFYIYPDLKYDELTFVEAARVFKANATERSVPLHALHHQQVETAVKAFQAEVSLQALGEKVSVKLGPNEQKAIALVAEFSRLDIVNESEKQLLLMAQAAIRRGRFQKLPRDINQVIKDAKQNKWNRAEILSQLTIALLKFPLDSPNEPEEADTVSKLITEKHKPQIIISESFA